MKRGWRAFWQAWVIRTPWRMPRAFTAAILTVVAEVDQISFVARPRALGDEARVARVLAGLGDPHALADAARLHGRDLDRRRGSRSDLLRGPSTRPWG